MEFKSRLRVATVLAALALSWFAIATILGETFTPKPAYFTQETSPRRDQLLPGSVAERLATAAPLRGDLLSRVAFDRSAQLLKPGSVSGTDAASPELLTARASALSAFVSHMAPARPAAKPRLGPAFRHRSTEDVLSHGFG